ncbi:hypothetical protein QT971_19500 [Microcoleus sp. herbarium19]|uniref:hypothetical protein n=1 Tax=Microcoleus sp. herbarium19 TaxID=3055440 RepID=UPI002FD1B5B4
MTSRQWGSTLATSAFGRSPACCALTLEQQNHHTCVCCRRDPIYAPNAGGHTGATLPKLNIRYKTYCGLVGFGRSPQHPKFTYPLRALLRGDRQT